MNFDELHTGLDNIEVEENGLEETLSLVRDARDKTIYFIGNGGSAAVASHMAIDYGKNGRFAALCFNDGAALTCLSNDLGYGRVFSDPIKRHCKSGDLLFAMSSSGRSMNIVNGVWQAKHKGAVVITLSGFERDNLLRHQGKINFYVPSHKYGVVEISHLAILHSILDRVMDEVDR